MNQKILRSIPALLLSLLAVSPFGSTALSAEDSELKELREQLQALTRKIQVLERKQEIRDEEAAAAAKTAPKVTVSDKGFGIASPDNANWLKFRGLVQFDSRVFFDDNGILNNTFLIRRARIIAEGAFAKNYAFQIVPEFGGGSGTAASAFSLLDANINVNVSKALQFKAGKFKSPVGLELLQSDSWTFFDERSLVTNLVPNRDVGLQASGDLFNGTVNYTAAVLNGVADGATSTNADFDNEKEAVGRLWFTPFRNAGGSPAQGLGFGISASLGREKGTAGHTAGYKTDGQQTFFSYAATTITDGENWRLSPQFDYRNGAFGALGEYVVSTVNVRPSLTGPKKELQNKAWQLAAGYVLTGEDSAPTGVVPKSNFDFANGTWGAFEIAARYARLKIDDAAFPVYASVSSNADEASSWGLGLNWYLSKAVRLTFDYYNTNFDFAPGAPAVSSTPVLRQDEKSLITRLQVSF